MNIKLFVSKLIYRFSNLLRKIEHTSDHYSMSQFGHSEDTSVFEFENSTIAAPHKVFMYENTNIFRGAKLIISPRSKDGRFIVKRNSGAAENLVVITGNHKRSVEYMFKDISTISLNDEDKDVVIEEEVWIGANVTLLAGVVVGRGSTIGAGSVLRMSVPPYSVVVGNPAKVVGFNFTPEEIIEHEKLFYREEERLEKEVLDKNYKKYFLDHIKDIKVFTSQICK